MFKRGVDIAVAALMLLLCLPLLVVCALLIKIDSRGPILFRQTRMGRGFKTFTLLKLRTMRDAEKGPPSPSAPIRASRAPAVGSAHGNSTNCLSYGTSCAAR